MSKTGLVLSGGGAKGAYQVGVMQALNEMNIDIDMISGASIGALNGAVLASAPDIQTGTDRLRQLWERLAEEENVIELNIGKKTVSAVSALLKLPMAAGLGINPNILKAVEIIQKSRQYLNTNIDINSLKDLIKNAQKENHQDEGWAKDRVLQEMMNQFLDIEQLQKSIPLYVSIFKNNALGSIIDLFLAGVMGIDNAESEFFHIQTLPIEQQKKYLLASAAIPILFAGQSDESGENMVDGGMGGYLKNQGNTPINPLIQAGCEHVIVTHLSHSSLWSRTDFPNTTIYEIIPNRKLAMGISKMFDFSKESIEMWMKYGYEDTMEQMGKIRKTLNIFSEKRNINRQLEHTTQTMEENTRKMEDFFEQFKK